MPVLPGSLWRREVQPRASAGTQSHLNRGMSCELSVIVSNLHPTFQEIRNPLQLGDLVLIVATVLLQQREHVVVLVAGVALVKSLQIGEHSSPSCLLLRGVLNAWDLLTTRNVSTIIMSEG